MKKCICKYHNKCKFKSKEIINNKQINVCNYFKFYCEYCYEQ